MKDLGSPSQRTTARFVTQAHKDKEKPYMSHDIKILKAASVRMILIVAAIKGFGVHSHDVNQANIQRKDQKTRKVYIMPKAKDLGIIGITENELLELLSPLYGMCR